MRETVLNFSSKFLDLLFDGVKPASEEFYDKYSELKRMTKGKAIKMNGKELDYSSWIIYVFARYNDSSNLLQSKAFLPEINSTSRNYYFWDFDNSMTSTLREAEGTLFLNHIEFKDKWEQIGQDISCYFKQNPKNSNEYKTWNNIDMKLFLTSKVLVFYDKYILKDKETIENNLLQIFNNYNKAKELLVIIFTTKDNESKQGNLKFSEAIKKVDEFCKGTKVQFSVVSVSSQKMITDRLLLTDYFIINANHSFQALKDKGVKESEMNFKPLLKECHHQNYQSKISHTISLIESIDIKTELFGDFTKEQLIEKLRSL